MSLPTIAIIGSGKIGAGLARALARAGYPLVLAVRRADPPRPSESLRTLAEETGATTRTIADAVAQADVAVLAVPYGAVADVAAQAQAWRGKIVVDCTNPIGPGGTLLEGHTGSGAEIIAAMLPGARVVKSFNAQGAENLTDPHYHGMAATNFYCGDDADAKQVVLALIEAVGFDAVDLGPLQAARFLEPMTLAWFAASRALGSRRIAFRVLR